MKNKRLGVNIDHVATIRNARLENYPNPVRAALIAENSGADSITIHLREDRRHIRDLDFFKIKKFRKIPLNLEIAPTNKMLKIALKNKPNFVCIVPEKRKEITTEGGLNLIQNQKFLKKIIYKLKSKNIRVSLFIDPKISDIKISKTIGADCVELHTGNFCNLYNKKKYYLSAFNKLKKSSVYAYNIGLDVHAGHGLTYKTAHQISRISTISEFNIGHFIIAESIFTSLRNSIKRFKKILNKLNIPALTGVTNKVDALQKLSAEEGLDLSRVFYIGNDLNDFQAMLICGYSACPIDSHPRIKDIATFQLKKRGGSGIVRELLEEILKVDIVESLYSN